MFTTHKGIGLYAFLQNHPTSFSDFLGLWYIKFHVNVKRELGWQYITVSDPTNIVGEDEFCDWEDNGNEVKAYRKFDRSGWTPDVGVWTPIVAPNWPAIQNNTGLTVYGMILRTKFKIKGNIKIKKRLETHTLKGCCSTNWETLHRVSVINVDIGETNIDADYISSTQPDSDPTGVP